MSLSRLSRRWVASVALVSYLLAATISGMFHNHHEGHDGNECCAVGASAEATEGKSKPPRCSYSHRHHHAHHSHSGHAKHTDSTDAGRSSDRQPGGSGSEHRGPLRHSDCAACQFLAQQSVTTPEVALVATMAVARHVSETVETHVTTVIADAHPARGPPGRG